ncbi:translocation/assembly module TamB domain-containing protein, partial [Brevundimonas sp.]
AHITAKDGAYAGLGHDNHQWHLHADLSGLPVALLVPDMRGNISGEVLLGDAGQYITGTTRNLKLANLASTDDQGSNAPSVDLNVQANIDANALKLQLNSPLLNNAGAGSTASNLDVSVPLVNTGSLFGLGLNMDGPLSGTIQTNGQIGPLWNLFDGLDRKMSGRLTTALTISGTPKTPSIDGAIHLRDGTFEDVATGALIRKLNLDAHASNNGISVQHLSGNDFSEGTLCGYGYVALRTGYRQTRVESELPPCEGWQTANARDSRISSGGLTLDLNNFRIVRSETATVVASGKINALHNGSVINLTGRLDVNSAEISPTFPPSSGITRMDVIEYNRPAHLAPRHQAAARPASGNEQATGSGFTDLGRTPVRVNVTLNAESIMVRGRGLDLMLSSNATIQGSLTSPRLNGRAEVVRGTYEFGGKRFSFDPSGYATLDTAPERIRLNLSARREDADITAVINVTGTAALPRIELTSEPELPQDEILARVLFGRSVTQLSAIEAAQLASSVASLAGGGGLDVLGGLRQLAQLDSLSFSGDGTDLMISGGRRIGKNLFLEVQSGGRDGPAINVEWQVRNNIAVTSTMAGDGNAIISVRWRKPSN